MVSFLPSLKYLVFFLHFQLKVYMRIYSVCMHTHIHIHTLTHTARTNILTTIIGGIFEELLLFSSHGTRDASISMHGMFLETIPVSQLKQAQRVFVLT